MTIIYFSDGMKTAEYTDMNRKPRSLLVHLLIVVLVKLVVLALIWWFFIRQQALDVDADTMASKLGIPVILERGSK